MLATGLLCLLLSGGGGLAIWATTAGYNWYPYAPVWLLEAVAAFPGVSVQNDSLNELLTRYANGELSDERLLELATKGLSRQADADRLWATGWGNAIDAAADAGLLTDDQIAAYLR